MKLQHYLLIFLLLILNQCKETCHELPSLIEVTTPFLVIDSLSGANLLQKTNESDSDFNIDSIAVYNEDNKQVRIVSFYPVSSIGGYVAEFEFLSSRAGVKNVYIPDSSVFFIHWNSVDSDTLSVVYDYEEGRSECNWKTNRFDVFFNGKIVEPENNRGRYLLRK